MTTLYGWAVVDDPEDIDIYVGGFSTEEEAHQWLDGYFGGQEFSLVTFQSHQGKWIFKSVEVVKPSLREAWSYFYWSAVWAVNADKAGDPSDGLRELRSYQESMERALGFSVAEET